MKEFRSYITILTHQIFTLEISHDFMADKLKLEALKPLFLLKQILIECETKFFESLFFSKSDYTEESRLKN